MENNEYQQVESYEVETETKSEGKGKGLAIASMILGILSLVLGCCVPYVTIVMSIIGLILGIVCMTKNKGRGSFSGKGMAIAGIICNSIGIIGSIIMLLLIFSTLSAPGFMDTFMEQYNDALENVQ